MQQTNLSSSEQHKMLLLFIEKLQPIKKDFEDVCKQFGLKDGVSMMLDGKGGTRADIGLDKACFNKIVIE